MPTRKIDGLIFYWFIAVYYWKFIGLVSELLEFAFLYLRDKEKDAEDALQKLPREFALCYLRDKEKDAEAALQKHPIHR